MWLICVCICFLALCSTQRFGPLATRWETQMDIFPLGSVWSSFRLLAISTSWWQICLSLSLCVSLPLFYSAFPVQENNIHWEEYYLTYGITLSVHKNRNGQNQIAIFKYAKKLVSNKMKGSFLGNKNNRNAFVVFPFQHAHFTNCLKATCFRHRFQNLSH